MPATVVLKTKTITGSQRRQLAEVTLDNSYPAGGYALKPSSFSLRLIDDAQCTIKTYSGNEAVPVGSAFFNVATKKLVVQNAKTQAEFAAGTNLTGVVVVVEAWGR